MTNSSFSNPVTIFNTVQPGLGISTSNGTVSIGTNGISNALFRQSAASSLVGNSAGTTGNVADITLGTGLTFTGTTLAIGTSGVTAGTYGDVLSSSQITVDALGRISVGTTNALVQDGAGFVNKFRNPGMTIAQRGTSGNTTNSVNTYTLDGWMLLTVGANCAWGQVSDFTYAPTSGKALYWLGNTGNVNSTVIQRIEGSLCNSLAGQQVTVQAVISHNAGSAVVPRLVVNRANALDNWSSSTAEVSYVAFQSCPSGASTRVAYTFACSSSARNGLEVQFEMNGNPLTGTSYCAIGDVDIRATPGVSTGVNNSPPAIEQRSIQTELAICRRYLPAFSGNGSNTTIASGMCYSTTASRICVPFNVPARIAPTGISAQAASNYVVYNSAAANVTATSIGFVNASTTACNIDIGVASGLVAGDATLAITNGTSNNILFTGAEL